MAKSSRYLASIALCAGALALPALGAAQTPPATQSPAQAELEARSAFEQGVALARAERWGEAAEAFRRSRRLVARPSAALNLANSLVRLGHAIEAVAAFEDYLRLVADPAAEGERYTSAQTQLAVTRQSIARAFLTIDPLDATLLLDGQIADAQPASPATREVLMDPRSHTLEVRREGCAAHQQTVAPGPGERIELRVALRCELAASLRITALPGTATLSIDGASAALDTALQLPPGRHGLTLQSPGYLQHDQWITLRSGEQATLHFSLTARPVVQRSMVSNPWLWTGVGLGVAAVATAIVLGVVLAPRDLYGGTTGMVLETLRDPR